MVDSAEHGLVPGQIVLIELSLKGSEAQRKVIPYGAEMYDLHGETWVYTNPEPLVFVRHPIRVDCIEGDLAVLLEGPAAGTEVATVGVAELFGMSERTLVPTGRNQFVILEPGFRIALEGRKEKVATTLLDETRKLNGVTTRVVEEKEWKNGNLTEISRSSFAIL